MKYSEQIKRVDVIANDSNDFAIRKKWKEK